MHWIIDYYSEEVRLEIDYLPVGKKIVVLHSFIKKMDETPKTGA
jgi:phage-related protein